MSGALLADAARPSFARHETFPLRFGWLRKAYTAALASDGTVFSDPRATVKLGVGKNMVNAIRYWAQAYKILEEQKDPQRPRVPKLVPTAFGRALLDDGTGWDPWLEDPASLWLLHWQLLTPPTLAPAWWAAFHLFAPEQFDEQQLVDHLLELVAAAGWGNIVEASVKKDVDCLLRTFAVRRYGRQTMDDLLDCPARELGLLELAAGETKAWRFVIGASRRCHRRWSRTPAWTTSRASPPASAASASPGSRPTPAAPAGRSASPSPRCSRRSAPARPGTPSSSWWNRVACGSSSSPATFASRPARCCSSTTRGPRHEPRRVPQRDLHEQRPEPGGQ